MLRFALAWIALGGAAAAGPYDGLYRLEAGVWNCRDVGMDGGALAIRDGTFYGVESACRLENPTNVRDMNATLFDKVCTGEGETWQERTLIMTMPDGVVMLENNVVRRMIRCP